jgi:hypothetical protein
MSKKVFFFNSRPVDQRQFHFYTIERGNGIRSVQWISENRVALGLVDEGIEIWEIDGTATSAKIVKRFKHESVSFVYPLTCHCTFSITFFYNLIKDYITNVAWDERTKCLAAGTEDGWITVNCRCSFECWACHDELVFLSNRFGQWTATNLFTPQRSMANVRVWLGVQTGNKRTMREWTRPGNRPTISYIGLVSLSTDGSTSLKNGIERRGSTGSIFLYLPRSKFPDSFFFTQEKQEKWIGVNRLLRV